GNDREGDASKKRSVVRHVVLLEAEEADGYGPLVLGDEQQDRQEELVPGAQEAEDAEREQPRLGQRQHDAEEHLPFGGSIQSGRPYQRVREIAEEAPHEIDAERDTSADQGQDEPPEIVDQAKVLDLVEERHDDRFRWQGDPEQVEVE